MADQVQETHVRKTETSMIVDELKTEIREQIGRPELKITHLEGKIDRVEGKVERM